MSKFFTRVRSGTGFSYRDPNGKTITDKAIRRYGNGLGIPPAWSDVEISVDPSAKVLATGYDAAGRKQYIYHPGFRARREKVKFDRLLGFAERLPHMRQVTGRHLRRRKLDRQKVLACMVRLMDEASFRVGNSQYARINKTYGLTTLRSKHLKIDNDRLVFDFFGKSHQLQHKVVKDALLAKVVREADELPGYEIFKYIDEDGNVVGVTSDDVNSYIKEIMGEDFSAKDFRTWSGTLAAAVMLDEMQLELGDTPSPKHVTMAVTKVAAHLGNTPAIAKASYIDPRVIDHFLDGTTIRAFKKTLSESVDQADLGDDEKAAMALLTKRLRRKSP